MADTSKFKHKLPKLTEIFKLKILSGEVGMITVQGKVKK
jgi:hypothetical protein